MTTRNIFYHVYKKTYIETFIFKGVEKRKISYFGLALNLFQHLISSNQDDLSYPPRNFISG